MFAKDPYTFLTVRWIFVLFAVLGTLAPASAEPGETPQKKPLASDEQPTIATPPSLGVPRLHLQDEQTKGIVNLSPSHLFADPARSPSFFHSPEKAPGLQIAGDSWKAHVAQIGIMTAGFVALSALCGGGGCKLPSSLGKVLPSQLRLQEGPPDRPPADVRRYPQMR